jgi:hypothetical protein
LVGVIVMLAGFRSRWMTPFSWAASSAAAICLAMVNTSLTAIGPARFVRPASPLDQLENQSDGSLGFLGSVDRRDVG